MERVRKNQAGWVTKLETIIPAHDNRPDRNTPVLQSLALISALAMGPGESVSRGQHAICGPVGRLVIVSIAIFGRI